MCNIYIYIPQGALRRATRALRAGRGIREAEPAAIRPYTQPSEPILLPKLRIYFADFPYLHCSID